MDARFTPRQHFVNLAILFVVSFTPIISAAPWPDDSPPSLLNSHHVHYNTSVKLLPLNDRCDPNGSRGYCAPANSRCRHAVDDKHRCECVEGYAASSATVDPGAECYRNAEDLNDICDIHIQCDELLGHGAKCGTDKHCVCRLEDGYSLISSTRGKHECVQHRQVNETCRFDEECQFGRQNHFCDRNGTDPGVCAVSSGAHESSVNVIAVGIAVIVTVMLGFGIFSITLLSKCLRRRYANYSNVNPPPAEAVPNAAAGVNLEEGPCEDRLMPEKPRARLTSWP